MMVPPTLLRDKRKNKRKLENKFPCIRHCKNVQNIKMTTTIRFIILYYKHYWDTR
jgi:hypothetical protein